MQLPSRRRLISRPLAIPRLHPLVHYHVSLLHFTPPQTHTHKLINSFQSTSFRLLPHFASLFHYRRSLSTAPPPVPPKMTLLHTFSPVHSRPCSSSSPFLPSYPFSTHVPALSPFPPRTDYNKDAPMQSMVSLHPYRHHYYESCYLPLLLLVGVLLLREGDQRSVFLGSWYRGIADNKEGHKTISGNA